MGIWESIDLESRDILLENCKMITVDFIAFVVRLQCVQKHVYVCAFVCVRVWLSYTFSFSHAVSLSPLIMCRPGEIRIHLAFTQKKEMTPAVFVFFPLLGLYVLDATVNV